MIRAIASDNPEAFNEAIWSVGGSPPWGGVGWDEAAAIYGLLEAYMGSGMASDSAYDKAIGAVGADQRRRMTIGAFRANDVITSNSETFTVDQAVTGLHIAEQLADDALRALFLSYQAGAVMRQGNWAEAAALTRQSLDLFLELAEHDDVYETRVAQNAVNLVSMTANSGDAAAARSLLDQLGDLMSAEHVQMLSRALS
jgi:hypothetical protein